MALLHMLAARGNGLRAATVDHGLRSESAAEALQVARVCADLAVPHAVLKWDSRNTSGNLQDAARRARQNLISKWARAEGITHIALGHTFDDQAETVLMRLARGSGVDGLSGMAATRVDGDLTWIRPLLHARRDALRDYLTGKGVAWIEDPSNDDVRFDRVRVRQALAHLNSLGITAEGLVTTADRMQDAREVLEQDAVTFAKECSDITKAGEVLLDSRMFIDAPNEMRHRLLSSALMWISGEPYKPRSNGLALVIDGILNEGAGQTLHGCIIRKHGHFVTIRREPARVEGPRPIDDVHWDHRWEIVQTGDAPEGTTIAALGEKGLQLCENWRKTNFPREVLLTTPAIWSNEQLIAAPLAGFANEWEIRLISGKKGFYEALITR